MIDTERVKAAIAARADEFARELFGDRARRVGINQWRVGTHGSLAIDVVNGALLFMDHESGCGGDAIALWQRERGGTAADALRACAMWAGADDNLAAIKPANLRPTKPTRGPKLPDDATPGTDADLRRLADLRHVSPIATFTASQLGTLYFGPVCGFRCWILTDERRLCAEARRLDGEQFPAVGSVGERKAHTLKGSVKSWPVGIAPRGYTLDDFRALLVVEGGPDYLAALHFAINAKGDCLPVAFLGAGAATELHREAEPLFAGRRVRIYPHVDGAGSNAATAWTKQLRIAGAKVNWFDLRELRKADGSPVKDLNDATQLHPGEERIEAEDILP